MDSHPVKNEATAAQVGHPMPYPVPPPPGTSLPEFWQMLNANLEYAMTYVDTVLDQIDGAKKALLNPRMIVHDGSMTEKELRRRGL